MHRFALTFLFTLSFAALAIAGDWPQFRGSRGAGVAEKADLPIEWSSTKNLAWKTKLPGLGSSSPIVKGDRVYLTCYSGYGDGEEGGEQRELIRHLVCLDRTSGEILWKTDVPPALPEDPYRGFINEHGYASNSAVADSEAVYAFFGKSGAARFDLDGKQQWRVSLGMESSNRRWGSAASPIVYKDTVIVNAAEESRAIWALDKSTGKKVWKAEGESLELCFATPCLVDVGDHVELVVPVPGEVWGLNPDTGKLLWFIETGLTGNISPSVVAQNGVAYVFGGYRGSGSLAVRCGGKGDVTDSHVVWTSRLSSYVPSPIIDGEHLFWVDERGLANCVESATGKSVYRERLRGATGGGFISKPFYASLVKAGEHFIATSRFSGTFVYNVGPEFEQIAHNQFEEDETDFNATPAISGGQLFLRSNQFLYCVSKDEE